jgi:hypothetical protein
MGMIPSKDFGVKLNQEVVVVVVQPRRWPLPASRLNFYTGAGIYAYADTRF